MAIRRSTTLRRAMKDWNGGPRSADVNSSSAKQGSEDRSEASAVKSGGVSTWSIKVAAIVLTSFICGGALAAQQRPPFTSLGAAVAELETGGAERGPEALEYVLANLNLARADVLLTVAMGALQLKRTEDAGFLRK